MPAGRLSKKSTKKYKKVGLSGNNDNVNVNVKEKEKEKESKYAGDIKKGKNFLFVGDCVNDFFNVFNG